MHGRFEGLIYGDAEAYISSSRFNKPGTMPLQYSTEIEHSCPHDCRLCPDHQQHACLGIDYSQESVTAANSIQSDDLTYAILIAT